MMRSKLVWKDAVDLGLAVSISGPDGENLGLLAPMGGEAWPAPDLFARVQGQELLSLLAASADGEAFVDLVRTGDLQ